jgi:hypothetical protein
MKDPGTDLTAETPAKITSEGDSLYAFRTSLHPITKFHEMIHVPNMMVRRWCRR